MGTKHSPATNRNAELVKAQEAFDNFHNALALMTTAERRLQKRSILQATPNKYTRYELKKEF